MKWFPPPCRALVRSYESAGDSRAERRGADRDVELPRCRVLLRELLADPELGLVLLTGEQHLDRRVRGIYVTDLLDPRRYLRGGELVLSGLVWRSGPGDADRFVAALAAAGVAGLAAGTARLGDAPSDLVEACRRHDVPVLQVPVAVSFNALVERVLGAVRPEPASGGELVASVASGADLREVVVRAARELGADCWVFSPAGWVVGSGPELGERRRELVRRCWETPADDPGAVQVLRVPAGSRPESFGVWPAEVETEPPAARWLIAMAADRWCGSADQRALASEFATAVALLRTRADEARRIAGRSAETALSRAFDNALGPAELTARLETAGLPPGASLRVVDLSAGDVSAREERTSPGEDRDASLALLREVAAGVGTPWVSASRDAGACALFAAEPSELSTVDRKVREIAEEVEPGLGGRELRIGISDTTTAAGLRGALEEAANARRLASRSQSRAAVVSGPQLASHEVLLAAVPDELRNSYHQRVLSELLDYDRERGSELARSARMFLEYSGSWSRCAERLHIHINTLRYRIRRVEEITGCDLRRFADRVDLYLALEMLPRDSGSADASSSGRGARNERPDRR